MNSKNLFDLIDNFEQIYSKTGLISYSKI